MAIKTNFFDNTNYVPQDLINQWASLLTDGVFEASTSAFLVSAHSPANLSVDVAAGSSMKNGYYIKSDSLVNIPIVANTSGYNRIDIIVIELDITNKQSTIKALQGTPSSSPTAPLPTAYQLKIAEVSVGNNVSVINSGNIVDKRAKVDILDSSLAEKVNKAQATLIAATLSNGWTGSLKYRKNDMNQLQIEGLIYPGTLGVEIVVATFPTGYLPEYICTIPVYNSSAGTAGLGFVLKNDGTLRTISGFNPSAGNSIWVNEIIQL